MIVSGYSVNLYCDGAPDCPNRLGGINTYSGPAADFSDEERAQCYKDIRKAGWVLNRRVGTAVCPRCAKAGISPPDTLPED